MKTFGQVGYEGYFDAVGGKKFDMPTWDELSSHTRDAWQHASNCIIADLVPRIEAVVKQAGQPTGAGPKEET